MAEHCGFLELWNNVKVKSFNGNQFSKQYNVELPVNITCEHNTTQKLETEV